jgi:hypothetical protein
MKVFLSWSGSRSHAVAEALGEWLRQVIQAVDPWISSEIDKGARWQAEVFDKLEEAKVGIICLASSNLTSPWILFEAGALKKTKGSYVCTFLLDVAAADIEPPLGQFQHTIFKKDDVRKLVATINKAIHENGERPLPEATLASVFEKFWPDLELKLQIIAEEEGEKPVQRSERGLLEEILEMLRTQQRTLDSKITVSGGLSLRNAFLQEVGTLVLQRDALIRETKTLAQQKDKMLDSMLESEEAALDKDNRITSDPQPSDQTTGEVDLLG